MEILVEVAIFVLTDRAGRVLTQHRSHDAHPEPDRWTPPGGRLEPGEDATTAAHRELLEETGLTADLEFDRVVGQVGCSSPQRRSPQRNWSAASTCFLARYDHAPTHRQSGLIYADLDWTSSGRARGRRSTS